MVDTLPCRTLPKVAPHAVPVIGVGAMPLSMRGRAEDVAIIDHDDAIALLHTCFDAGLTLIDTARAYGPRFDALGHNERLVGEAVRTWRPVRDPVADPRASAVPSPLTIVTKIGRLRPGPGQWAGDASRETLLRHAEQSATYLGRIPDVVCLHRMDRQRPAAEAFSNMLAVTDAGLAGAIGLSNVTTAEFDLAWSVMGERLALIENERSPRYRGDGAVVTACVERGLAYLAWSPLGGIGDAARLGELYPEFAAVGVEVGATAQQVALAWLIAEGAAGPGAVIPIPGFTRATTVAATVPAATVVLTAQQVARLSASPAGEGSLFPDLSVPAAAGGG
ncbi:MAG: aldo/keto reductase [Actinomycetales bacterium]|nr:aldo/keto reductase [Actinomycetales bacterium]